MVRNLCRLVTQLEEGRRPEGGVEKALGGLESCCLGMSTCEEVLCEGGRGLPQPREGLGY